MSKTKEELNALKEEVESVNEKLQELTEEELAQVSGGGVPLEFNDNHDIGPGPVGDLGSVSE